MVFTLVDPHVCIACVVLLKTAFEVEALIEQFDFCIFLNLETFAKIIDLLRGLGINAAHGQAGVAGGVVHARVGEVGGPLGIIAR